MGDEDEEDDWDGGDGSPGDPQAWYDAVVAADAEVVLAHQPRVKEFRVRDASIALYDGKDFLVEVVQYDILWGNHY